MELLAFTPYNICWVKWSIYGFASNAVMLVPNNKGNDNPKIEIEKRCDCCQVWIKKKWMNFMNKQLSVPRKFCSRGNLQWNITSTLPLNRINILCKLPLGKSGFFGMLWPNVKCKKNIIQCLGLKWNSQLYVLYCLGVKVLPWPHSFVIFFIHSVQIKPSYFI